ncbi:hypothetical protein O9929_13540 [Vibrio lentus]|nr:hypothetical protein [Vibrio lentus]
MNFSQQQRPKQQVANLINNRFITGYWTQAQCRSANVVAVAHVLVGFALTFKKRIFHDKRRCIISTIKMQTTQAKAPMCTKALSKAWWLDWPLR